ncbi:C-type lectin-like [Heptranchias perlo]|uniref:C-type lectin-like n=1 Tax=Heptranchias perlo TaxID=212740 RepID=UPI003559572F
MVQPIGTDVNGSSGTICYIYVQQLLKPHHIGQLGERLEERNFTADMMLGTVLLLSALLVSDVAADVSLNGTSENQQQEAETDQDQDRDQRDVPERGFCPNGWFYFISVSSCYRFLRDRKTWIEAELSCQRLATGGHLASIHWKEQNHFIELLLKAEQSNNHVWIGLSDRHKEGTFLWTDGSLSDFKNWHLGEPDNYEGRENCVVINSDKWNDHACTGKFPFICSYKLHDW